MLKNILLDSPEDVAARSELMERARLVRDPEQLRPLGLFYLLYLSRHGKLIAFPVYGLLVGLFDRGVYSGPGLALGLERCFMAAVTYFLGCILRRYPRAPAWNEFYIVRWCVTGSWALLDEIWRRMQLTGPAPDQTGDTTDLQIGNVARWMVASVRARQPDFDADLSVKARVWNRFGGPQPLPEQAQFRQFSLLLRSWRTWRARCIRATMKPLDVSPAVSGAPREPESR